MRISYAQRRTCSSRLEHVVRSPAGKGGGPREGGEVGPGGPWLMREKRTSMSHRRWLAGLVALGLLATTACGSRLSDEERAAAVSAGADGSGGAPGPAEGTDGGVPGGGTALPHGPPQAVAGEGGQ